MHKPINCGETNKYVHMVKLLY